MTQETKDLKIRHIQTTQEFQALETLWEDLLAQNHTRSAFLTWKWLFSWWKVYGNRKQLWLITAWHDDALVGILPLALYTEKVKGLKLRTLRPMGSPLVDVCGILLKEKSNDVLHALSDYLIDHKKNWDTLELNHFTADDLTIPLIKQDILSAGLTFREKTDQHFFVELNESWDTFLASLSKGFRKNLRRAQKRAAESGQVTFEHFHGEALNWDIFKQIIEINKYAQHPLLYNSTDEQSLHKAFTQIDHTESFLTVFLLFIDDKPVAYEYGFIHEGRYESWRAGYDTRTDPRISVGVLLLQKVIEYAFTLQYKEVDFLRGEEPYKLRWKPQYREFSKLQFVKKSDFPTYALLIVWPKVKQSIKSLVSHQKVIEG